MPSSNKTAFLELNRWLGTDKPKRDDFNSDNLKIDQRMQQMDTTIRGQTSVINEQLTDVTRLEEDIEAQKTAITELEAHAASEAIHVTQADREKWDSGAAPQIFTYVGTGGLSQKVILGFRPKCGWLFAKGHPLISVNADAGIYEINSVYFSSEGNSNGIVLNADGLTVYHDSMSGPDGATLRLNRNGVTYICMIWR